MSFSVFLSLFFLFSLFHISLSLIHILMLLFFPFLSSLFYPISLLISFCLISIKYHNIITIHQISGSVSKKGILNQNPVIASVTDVSWINTNQYICFGSYSAYKRSVWGWYGEGIAKGTEEMAMPWWVEQLNGINLAAFLYSRHS